MGAKIILALVQLEIIALMVLMGVAMYCLGWAIAWYRILLRFGRIPPQVQLCLQERNSRLALKSQS